MNAPQTLRLAYRQGNNSDDGHDHGSQGHNHDHNHDDEHATEYKQEEPADPHGWLDPDNGIYRLGLMADKLGELDPQNQFAYELNANAAKAQLESLMVDMDHQLKIISGLPFVAFHDSHHCFEQRFDIHAQAAIALGDAELPGIRKMNTLKQQLSQYKGACVFTEPQMGNKIVASLTRGLSVSTGSLDPLGANQTPGPNLYISVLQTITNEHINCLKPEVNTD